MWSGNLIFVPTHRLGSPPPTIRGGSISAPHRPRFPQQDDFIGRYLRLAYLHLLDEVDAGTADRYPDVTPAMKQVLMFVTLEGSRLTDLADRAGMTKQAMGEHVDGLVALGILERVPDPHDGRAKLIRPTADGLTCMRDAQRVALGAHAHWEALLGPRKAAQLLALLRELTAKLDAEAAGAQGRQAGIA